LNGLKKKSELGNLLGYKEKPRRDLRVEIGIKRRKISILDWKK
jgi:hypothetical protein